MPDPINVLWTFVGLVVWPGLTFCIVLWKLGHPILGILALLFTGESSTQKIVRTKIVDSRTGRTIRVSEYEE